MTINPRFQRQVATNVRYWYQKTADLSDTTLGQIDQERHNLYRAIQFGLNIKETMPETTRLVARLFELPERRGYWSEWLPILEKAVAACDENDEFQLATKIRLLNQLGFLYRLNRQIESAVSLHSQVINKAHDRFPDELIKARFYLGNAYYDARQYDQARYFAESAHQKMETTKGTSSNSRKAAVLNLLGLINHAQGYYGQAKQLYEQAIAAWQETNERTYHARTWNNLGLTNLELEAFEPARQCFLQASHLLASTVSELDKIKAQMFDGLTYFQEHKWALAEAAFKKAHTPFLWQSGDLYHQALLLNNLGNSYLMQEKFDEAEACLTESIDLWAALSDEMMLGNSQGALAEALAAKNQTGKALAICGEAINRLQSFSDNAWVKKRAKELQSLHDKLKSSQPGKDKG